MENFVGKLCVTAPRVTVFNPTLYSNYRAFTVSFMCIEGVLCKQKLLSILKVFELFFILAE